MSARARFGAALVAACVACALVFIGAVSAPAAGTPIEDYRAGGEARGLDVGFTFTGSLFERLVDLGVPAAKSDVNSEGGAASRGSGAQVYPGDLVIGAAGEQIPGYRQAVYPPTKTDPGSVDDSHLTDTFQLPGIIAAGPLVVETGHIRATASANEASGLVTTNQVSLGMGMPLITIKHLETTSQSTREIDHVVHLARTVASDITILVSPALSVHVGSLVSQARTTSDGSAPTAETALTVSDVTVVLNGTPYRATIDQQGIHLIGPFPSQVPSLIPQDLHQPLQVALKQANVKIATSEGSKQVEDVTGDASIGGLLVTFTGTVPNVFTPLIVDELVAQVEQSRALPKAVRDRFEKSICYESDIKPHLPKQIVDNPSFPDLPLCFSQQIIPGPGSGVTTTFSIGSVHSVSAAVQSVPIIQYTPPSGGGGGGVFGPPIGGGPVPGGFTSPPPTGTTGPPQARQRLTGLVARLPSAALYGSGLAFFALAIGLAFGPSLRRWRSSPAT